MQLSLQQIWGNPCSVLMNVTVWEVPNGYVLKIYFKKNTVCLQFLIFIELAKQEDPFCHQHSRSGFWAQNDNVCNNADCSLFYGIEIDRSSVYRTKCVYRTRIWDTHWQFIIGISIKRVNINVISFLFFVYKNITVSIVILLLLFLILLKS